jgi:PTS system nitrogen regulatory IIA component
MHISDVLQLDHIKVFLDATSKDEVIEELFDVLMPGQEATARAQTLAAVLEREALCSTGIGHGAAIPHAKLADGDEIMVAFGLAEKPVDFDAIDGNPVRIFILILCPERIPSLQLRFLARASRLLHDSELRDQLLACRDAKAVHDTFREYEELHFG